MPLNPQPLIIIFGAYLVCGFFWARYNRKRPALYQIMAPDFLVILLWPLGFYRTYLRSFWHPQRFLVCTNPPEEYYPYEQRSKYERHFSSRSRALAYALQAAKEEGRRIVISDLARLDNFLGNLVHRMYWVEPSGEVAIASHFPRKRIIRKASHIEQSAPSDTTDSENGRSSNPSRLPFIVAIASLALGIPPIWPYGYYVLLRLIVCGVAVYGAMQANSQQRMGWVWTLGATAVLFNPLIPVHLMKDTWVFIDLITAILLGVAMSVLRRKPNP